MGYPRITRTAPVSTPDEKWMPIQNWDDLYWVSSQGNVWSTRHGRLISAPPTPQGYPRVNLKRSGGHGYIVTVHSLVAAAFHGPRPSKRHDVDHLNGIKTDNRAINLEWVTRKVNAQRAFAMGLSKPIPRMDNRGELHPSAKLTTEQVIAIRDTPHYVGVGRDLALQYGVSQQLIGALRSGKRWTHLTKRN